MRVTEKGRVTIPKHIRERLGIGPGSEVEFVVEAEDVKLRKVDHVEGETRGERMMRLLREAGRTAARTGLTTDEIMEMTRGPFDDVDPR